MADPGTPDWWLERLYRKLRERQPLIRTWDEWYTGEHPAPQGYEKAGTLFQRLLETVGLNMLALVTDAGLDRMHLEGFKVNGKASDDVWDIWQANNFDRGFKMVLREKMALSESYTLVDPNGGDVLLTPEHPEQCIVEMAPGSSRERAAALKVWQDDLGEVPVIRAMLYLPDAVYAYSAPRRAYADGRAVLALKPSWELQVEESGGNPLGEVPLIPFSNRSRMMRPPLPEFYPAIRPQRRINKTLMDRMAMQDQGAFKAMWATGVSIPEDPATGLPVEPFKRAVDRSFISENPQASFGQLEAEDIKQMLEAVRDDIADCAIVVPTSADQILAKLVNVSGDGLKLAQVSEIKRVRERMSETDDPAEDVARLSLKAAGKSVPNANRMTTDWRNPEYRTDTEQANAAVVAINAGMPREAAWERYFNASPDEIKNWRSSLNAELLGLDPSTMAALGLAQNETAAGGNADPSTGQ